MLLDIGAKTSNLLFFEKGKVFSRSINLGANSITQDFANEVKLKFDAAEKLKIEEGFVSLGGAYEEPENPHQAAISKIARQFMTRLHIQVNQTMQFYRGQQGGSAPQRLFLSGGASVMPYTAQFFAEKLNVPVEYFNPFRNVQIDPAVNLEDLARVAHSLGEVVGLGLRNLAHCPMELNLIPESTRRWQSFNEKKPYLVATVFCLVAVVAAMGLLFQQLAGVKAAELAKVSERLEPLKSKDVQFQRAYRSLKETTNRLDQLSTWMEERYYWADVLTELHRVFVRTEDITQQKLRTETGVWIEKFLTATPSYGGEGAASGGMNSPFGGPPSGMPPAMSEDQLRAQMMERYGIYSKGPNSSPAPGPTPSAAEPGGQTETTQEAPALASSPTNDVTVIELRCRAVDLQNVANVASDANTLIIYTLADQLRASTNMFDPAQTKLIGQSEYDAATKTFTFGVSVALKHPLKL